MRTITCTTKTNWIWSYMYERVCEIWLTQRWAEAPPKSKGPALPAQMWFYELGPWSAASAALIYFTKMLFLRQKVCQWFTVMTRLYCPWVKNVIGRCPITDGWTYQVECFAVWFDFMFLHVLYKAAVCVSVMDIKHIISISLCHVIAVSYYMSSVQNSDMYFCQQTVLCFLTFWSLRKTGTLELCRLTCSF